MKKDEQLCCTSLLYPGFAEAKSVRNPFSKSNLFWAVADDFILRYIPDDRPGTRNHVLNQTFFVSG